MRRLRCLLVLLIVLLPAGPFATTFPVTKTADTNDGTCDPDCSLREAIEAANTNTGADDVPIPAGFYLLTLGQLTVSDDVSIAGAGQADTIIDGNASGRVFDIQASVVAEISGVTIRNGASSSNGGGSCIRNKVYLTLTDSTVSGNNFVNSIFNAGELSLTNSTVSDNYNGISNVGELSLTNSTVSGSYGYTGPGIYNSNGTVTLTNSTVSGHAARYGAGIHNSYGTVTLTNSTVSDNDGGNGDGAGIFNRYGTVTLINSTVSGNSAAYGGGIHNYGGGYQYSYGGTVTLVNSTVSGNTAVGSGGRPGAGFGRGGGIYSRGELSLTNSTVSGNESFGGGGGIFIDLSMSQYGVTITNSTVSDNHTISYNPNQSLIHLGGGGILVFGRSDLSPVTLTLVNSTVSGNYAFYPANGIRNTGGTIILTNSTVSGNAGFGFDISNSDGAYGGTITATNTIVADHGAIGGAKNCESPINSLGYNLTDDTSCGFSATGDLIVADAMLGPLQDNGGPTETHDLLEGSPAIDAANDASCPTTDQRGAARPFDGDGDGMAHCDIGSVEYLPEPHQAATMVAGAAFLALLYRRRTQDLEGTVCSGQY